MHKTHDMMQYTCIHKFNAETCYKIIIYHGCGVDEA